MAKSRMWIVVLRNGKEFMVMAQTKELAKASMPKVKKVLQVKSVTSIGVVTCY